MTRIRIRTTIWFLYRVWDLERWLGRVRVSTQAHIISLERRAQRQ